MVNELKIHKRIVTAIPEEDFLKETLNV